MRDWEIDKALTDRAIPKVKSIMGCFLFRAGGVIEDCKQATDIILCEGGDHATAVRLRSDSYRARYGEQFTIRYDRPSGAMSELQKIMSGYAQWMFYGFIDDSANLTAYVILKLNFLRCYLWDQRMALDAFYIGKNTDDSSQFLAIPLADLPKNVIAHRWVKTLDNKQTGVKQIIAGSLGKAA